MKPKTEKEKQINPSLREMDTEPNAFQTFQHFKAFTKSESRSLQYYLKHPLHFVDKDTEGYRGHTPC